MDERANAFNDGWLDRFWTLPPEVWSTAVDLRLEEIRLRKDGHGRQEPTWDEFLSRNQAFWSRHGHSVDPPNELESIAMPKPQEEPPSLTAEEIEDFGRIAEKVRSEEGGRPVCWTGKFLQALKEIEQAEALIKADPRPLGEPWDTWIAALPEEAREEGRLACLTWRDMIRLRNRLHEAVKERRILSGILEGEAQRVLDVRMFELRGQIQAYEKGFAAFVPFFDRYGKPPLADVNQVDKTSARNPDKRAEVKARRR